ncbi:MAG: PA2779 family protein [Nitrospiria bacterium]
MVLKKRFSSRRILIVYLIVAIFLLPTVKAWAMFMPSHESASLKGADLKQVQTFLEAKIVRQRLSDLGLPQEEIEPRMSRLSEADLHQLASQIDSLYPGGDGLGVVAGLLVIAILVVVLLQVTGHKVIITK